MQLHSITFLLPMLFYVSKLHRPIDMFYDLQIIVHNFLQVVLWRHRMFQAIPFSSSALTGCFQVVAIMPTEPLVCASSMKCSK